MVSDDANLYAKYLRDSEVKVLNVNGIDWFEYNGFLLPAYLPHKIPAIDRRDAKMALSKSGAMFARWTSNFDQVPQGEWWYVIRDRRYSISDLSSNTRSKISRGLKKLQVREVTSAEILEKGYEVCRKAVVRYAEDGFLPVEGVFNKRIAAAGNHGETIEYCGVYYEDVLVGFSENYIQDGGVFFESIWYDPQYMGLYSSYALTHFMLERYLGRSDIKYVSDGARSLYHETNVQKFFCEKFGFRYAGASLHVVYSARIALLIWLLFPFRSHASRVLQKLSMNVSRKLGGLMEQERIRRACGDGVDL